MIQLYLTIWRISGRRQVFLILLSIAIAAMAAVPLAFQKEIINVLTRPDPLENKLFLLGAGMVAVLMLGGWLVLHNRTDVGTVVAATMGCWGAFRARPPF